MAPTSHAYSRYNPAVFGAVMRLFFRRFLALILLFFAREGVWISGYPSTG